MQSKESNGLIFVRLFCGEEVIGGLTKACKKHDVETAVILSGLGQMKDIELGYFIEKGKYGKKIFFEPLELTGLSGMFSKHEGSFWPHVHGIFSNKEMETFSGHLNKATVTVTLEAVLLKSNLKAIRKEEQDSGLMGLFLE